MATATDVDLGGPVELVALSIKDRAARCRFLRSHRIITLRASGFWGIVPGEIVVVKPRKQWSYAGHPYLSGEIFSTRLEVPARRTGGDDTRSVTFCNRSAAIGSSR
jgi:hypothetical protein